MVISITNSSYIKSLPLATYRQQRRGGVGIIGMEMKEDDYIEHLFVCSTHDYLLFFTNRGKVYRSKVYDLPEAGRTSKGRYLGNVLPLRDGERVQSVLATRDFSETDFLMFATRQGIVKKTEFGKYNTPIKADGIIAINIRDDDELVAVRRVDPGDEILMVSHEGLTVRFREEDARAMGRDTSGVRGMDVSGKDNYVLAMDVARPGQDLLVVTENGYGKRTGDRRVPPDLARRQGRQDDQLHRGQGPAGRGAGGQGAPGPRLHLPERDRPAHRRARHQPLRPDVAGRARDEAARGRRGVRGRAGGRVRRAGRRRDGDGADAGDRGAAARPSRSSRTPTVDGDGVVAIDRGRRRATRRRARGRLMPRHHAAIGRGGRPLRSATLERPEKGGGPKLSDSYSGTLEVSGR